MNENKASIYFTQKYSKNKYETLNRRAIWKVHAEWYLETRTHGFLRTIPTVYGHNTSAPRRRKLVNKIIAAFDTEAILGASATLALIIAVTTNGST